MTTILTDGRYLCGDHRTTNNFSGRTDIETGIKKSTMYNDVSVKVHLLPPESRITIEKEHRVLALGFAGLSIGGQRFMDALKILGDKPLEFSQVIALSYGFLGDRGLSMIGVTDTFHSFRVTSGTNGKIELIKPDHWLMLGTGTDIINAVTDVVEVNKVGLTHQDLMLAAARCDKGTSPSYSVFGVAERVFYPSVIPSKKDWDKSWVRVTKAMAAGRKVNTKSFLNTTTYEKIVDREIENDPEENKPSA